MPAAPVPAGARASRRAVLAVAAAVLLAGPTAIAFFSGGYFDGPRVVAGLIAWVLVAIAMIASRRPLPRGVAGRVAIAALLVWGCWTTVSLTWAPIAGSAYHYGQRVLLYGGVLIAAAALLRERAMARIVEPALAAGIVIVIGYGLSERMLPGLLHFARSISAQGRLEQPLTYWNAMGELAALGVVLCARLAGDARRLRAVRLPAAAATGPLGLGLYLSVSRGALFACLAGLVCLIVLSPRRAQLRALVLAVAAGLITSLVAARLHGVTSLADDLASRERQGAIMLAASVVIAALAALGQRSLMAREDGPLGLPARAPWIAAALVVAGLGLAIAFGSKESSRQPLSSGAARYETLQSNRYAYWSVALRAFGDEPLHGVGAGGWAVYWLRYRTVNEGAQDAHSLPLQTLAEEGLVGFALLLAVIVAVGLAGRRGLRYRPALTAGPIAALVTYLVHAPLDWDWEMPAVTLIAIVLAGLVLAAGDPEPVL